MPEKNLVVIGDGPEYTKIKKMAGLNVLVLGHQKHDVLKRYLSEAKAFIFAAEEDFGIVVLEAQASGTPVIAFGKGGALETIRGLGSESPTGVFFYEQNKESIKRAIDEFEFSGCVIKASNCKENAEKFSKEIFKRSFANFMDEKISTFQNLK